MPRVFFLALTFGNGLSGEFVSVSYFGPLNETYVPENRLLAPVLALKLDILVESTDVTWGKKSPGFIPKRWGGATERA